MNFLLHEIQDVFLLYLSAPGTVVSSGLLKTAWIFKKRSCIDRNVNSSESAYCTYWQIRFHLYTILENRHHWDSSWVHYLMRTLCTWFLFKLFQDTVHTTVSLRKGQTTLSITLYHRTEVGRGSSHFETTFWVIHLQSRGSACCSFVDRIE